MAIVRDNLQTLKVAGPGTSFTLPSYTVASASDRVLVVTCVIQRNSTGSITGTCTYGGVTLSQAATETGVDASRRCRSYIWYLIAPAVGTADIVVDTGVTTVANVIIGAETLQGADQAVALGGTATATGLTTSTLTITGCAAGSLMVGFVGTTSAGTPTWAWTTATEIYDLNNGNTVFAPASSAAVYAVATSGDKTIEATRSAGDTLSAAVAAEFLAVASAGGQATRTMHQARQRRAG